MTDFKVPLDEIDECLSKIGAYLAVKVRSDENARLEIDLYCSINRVREYFKIIKDIMNQDKGD